MKTDPIHLLKLLDDRTTALSRIVRGEIAASNVRQFAEEVLHRGETLSAIRAQLDALHDPRRRHKPECPEGFQYCPTCLGSGVREGWTVNTACGMCHGQGIILKPETIAAQAQAIARKAFPQSEADRRRQEE